MQQSLALALVAAFGAGAIASVQERPYTGPWGPLGPAPTFGQPLPTVAARDETFGIFGPPPTFGQTLASFVMPTVNERALSQTEGPPAYSAPTSMISEAVTSTVAAAVPTEAAATSGPEIVATTETAASSIVEVTTTSEAATSSTVEIDATTTVTVISTESCEATTTDLPEYTASASSAAVSTEISSSAPATATASTPLSTIEVSSTITSTVTVNDVSTATVFSSAPVTTSIAALGQNSTASLRPVMALNSTLFLATGAPTASTYGSVPIQTANAAGALAAPAAFKLIARLL